MGFSPLCPDSVLCVAGSMIEDYLLSSSSSWKERGGGIVGKEVSSFGAHNTDLLFMEDRHSVAKNQQ